MVDKYLKVGSFGIQEERLFQTVSSGTAGAGIGIATNSDGVLDQSLLPAGLDGALTLIAEVEVNTGDVLHINSTGGYVLARAGAIVGDLPRYANAIARTAASSGDPVPGILPGNIAPTGSGVGVGANLFLRAAGGTAANPTPPGVIATGSGGLNQRLGRSYTSTLFSFNPGEPTVLSGN